jgi:hypothetical protein
MKKLLLILLLGLSAYYSQGQTLRINKYLVDSMISAGVQVLYHDTSHNGNWQVVRGGGSGGSGSGTVNSGTQYRIAYYATTGTAISQAAAIAASRALVSDVNGVPTHSATTATELGYVSGVTSAIQTQFTGKLSTSLTSANIFVGNVSNIATGVAMTGDIGITNAGVTTIANNAVTTAKILDANVTIAKLSATGTPSATNVLAGDNTWKDVLTFTFTAPATSDLLVLSNSTTAINKNITTLITAGTNVSFTGSGTVASPLVINASSSSAVTDSIQEYTGTFPALGNGNIALDTVARRIRYRLVDGDSTYVYTVAIQDSTVTYSGGGGGGLVEINFEQQTNLTESPANTWTPAAVSGGFGNTGLSNLSLPANTEGYIEAEYATASSINAAFGLITSNTQVGYGSITYGFDIGSGGTIYYLPGVTSTGSSVTTTQKVRVHRAMPGGLVTLQKWNGSSWSVIHSYTGSETTAELFIVCDIYGVLPLGELVNPQGEGIN